MFIYVLSKTKVKLGRLEVPFKKNSFGKKNNCQIYYLYSTGLGIHDRRKSKFKKEN